MIHRPNVGLMLVHHLRRWPKLYQDWVIMLLPMAAGPKNVILQPPKARLVCIVHAQTGRWSHHAREHQLKPVNMVNELHILYITY